MDCTFLNTYSHLQDLVPSLLIKILNENQLNAEGVISVREIQPKNINYSHHVIAYLAQMKQ